MSWVTIDQEKCNLCEICVARCMQNFRNIDGAISPRAGEATCIVCGHCIALCPTDAIVHEKMDMDNFPSLDRKKTFDRDAFVAMVRGRRSHRHFKDKKIPREDLEALVELCRYAPTGSNRQLVEMVVIENAAKVAKLAKLSMEAFGPMYAEDRKKREAAGEKVQEDPIFYQAPAVIVFHGPSAGGPPKYDCVIAAQTVVLAAETLGLGSCYIGMFEFAWHQSDAVKKELDLPEGNAIGSVLILGYPKLTFLRTVDRLPMTVRWE